VLVPVRCFTCGNLIADKYNDYQTKLKVGEDPEKILNELKINRYCCRRMLLTTAETIQQVIPFYESIYKRKQEVLSELD
jgi:DNA-directed RNA polymerase subunit N